MSIKRALTIAGSDIKGGAGLEADLKTFQERDVFGMTAITTIVVSRADLSHNVYTQPLSLIEEQIEGIVEVMGVDAMKTGMLYAEEIIELVARKIKQHSLPNVVIDPVMVCKGSDTLIAGGMVSAMRELLIPTATVVTPNLQEAATLTNKERIATLDEMKEAARQIHSFGPKYVLVKGGKLDNSDVAVDVLYDGKDFELLETERIETPNTPGAGCTYSAAITAELAKGNSVPDAVKTAKAFITAAIRHSFSLGIGFGPTNHAAYRKYGQAK
jgi:pyridoxine kinase